MNRRINGFIKKPHIFVDKRGMWVFNNTQAVSDSDFLAALSFCHYRNFN